MMPTKTVALSDEAYDLLREVPKGSQSAFVTEAILAVSKHDKLKALHLCQLRLTMIEKGLQGSFPVQSGTKTKRNPKGVRRFNSTVFFEWLVNEYGDGSDDWLEWWLE